MKKIFNLFVVVSLLFIYSCNDNADFNTDDLMTGTAEEGGAIVAVNASTVGKLLGIPSSQDFETATVSIAEVTLDMEVILMSGGQGISQYEIVKSLNGGPEAVVSTSATLPISASYSTTAEFIDGLGISLTDLRIGDVISFRTKMTKADGSAVYAGPADGSYGVTVSCSSDLAKTYDVLLHYVRASTATDVWYQFQDTFTETGVGEYRTSEVGPWIGGLGVGVPGMTITDVCGQITVPEQNLVEFYSNLVAGSGYIDGDTGIIYLDYEICASDCRVLTAVYTPVD